MKKFLGVPQELNWGFIIICTDSNHINLENTINSIKANYKDSSIVCVQSDEIKDFNCKSNDIKFVKTKPNYAAMINTGMTETNKEWNIIFIAGTYVRKNITRKYSMFIESKSDVIFPNDFKKSNFVDGTINGLCIHKEFFTKVGNFNEVCEKLEHSKAEWGFSAATLGGKFKAICHAKSI